MNNSNTTFFIFLLLFFTAQIYLAQEDIEVCMECHADKELTKELNGKEISLFVHQENFLSSVHSEVSCIDCHSDIDPEDLPHDENLQKVDCSECHEIDEYKEGTHSEKKVECYDCHTKHSIRSSEEVSQDLDNFCVSCHSKPKVKSYLGSIHYQQVEDDKHVIGCLTCHGETTHSIKSADFKEEELHQICSECHQEAVTNFEKSLHGKALSNNIYLAPNCITCHNSHNIISSDNPKSNTYVMNIPNLCGECHKEGTSVSQLRDVDKKNVLNNYRQSIHGDGLFRRGLTVTAVCTSCHFSHNILPHENKNSSINRNNVPKTCMQCHAQIEQVHQKVIKGELWEKEPNKVPVCIDCHQPHEVRRVFYEDTMADNFCLSCHKEENLSRTVNGEKQSLFVDESHIKNSVHKDNSCIKCHANMSISKNPVCKESGKVDCAICHQQQMDDYQSSTHGILYAQGNKNVPDCNTCHGSHQIKPKSDLTSKTFPKNITKLCGDCHEGRQDELNFREKNVVKNYEMSIHGRGLLASGLLVTATCADCHTAHKELPKDDINSSVHHNNIPETCAKCHYGIYEEFRTSIHSPDVNKTDKQLPVCNDCHSSHTIERVDIADFRTQIYNQCGRCHEDVTETYFDTFHGKVSKLGSERTAKCHDCHGSHNILPPTDINSTLSRQHVVETCKKCHPNSNRKFVGYLTHATHHDRDKYPVLFYTFWGMTILLIGTFTFFGAHTLLWLPRSIAVKKTQSNKENEKENKQQNNDEEVEND